MGTKKSLASIPASSTSSICSVPRLRSSTTSTTLSRICGVLQPSIPVVSTRACIGQVALAQASDSVRGMAKSWRFWMASPAPTQAMFDRIRAAPADLGLTDVYNGLQALEEPAAIRTQPPMEAEMVILATNRHVSGNVWEEEEGTYELQSTPSMIAARMAPPV
ncbi:uncharacterized protein B0H18DRAFT_1129707 [Fomitopsis serialis]|uniref:uncharacterized protein n=1 Tax=Fomitopsis serialis TaxID=139415 RepID=UPI002007EC7D|nr:uncharacterized protein B0H18DRAFT_1129707 [Neoantrodia serialis]KAH9910658.1 hypothetical protein B0H18DRAFT_1129707 [Neoantrodia serialis]